MLTRSGGIRNGGGNDGRMRPLAAISVVASVASVLIGISGIRNVANGHAAKPPPGAQEAMAKQPLRFEENRGQADPTVRFISRGKGYSLFLTPAEAVVALAGPATPDGHDPANEVVRMRLSGAEPNPVVKGHNRLPGVTNYLFGNDPAAWVTGVPSYSSVRYDDVYPGISAVYYGDDEGQLEYDFIVAPGVDPSAIAMSFEGAKDLHIDPAGDLVLATPSGEIRQRKPVVYQKAGGRREAVAGRYAARGDNNIGFELGDYDRSRPLVIDPVLVYSTYLGGGGADEATGIAVDAAGAAYVTGFTTSSDFPTQQALDPKCGVDGKCDPAPDGNPNPNNVSYSVQPDVFVTKLAPDGQALVYSTYIGGKGDDRGTGIALDGSGNAYVTGGTTSPDFPVTKESAHDPHCGSDGTCDFRLTDAPGDDPTHGHVKADAFLVKLNGAGTGVSYGTYIGGGGDDARPQALFYHLATLNPTEPGDPHGPRPPFVGGVAVDGEIAYVTGPTLSPDLATTPDAFDRGCGTGSSRDCNKFYCDHTQGCPPPTGNAQTTQDRRGMIQVFPDAQLTVIDTRSAKSGSLRYASYFGGSGTDVSRGVAVTSAMGSIRTYITGDTETQRFNRETTTNPLTNPPVPEPYPTTGGAFQTATRIDDSPSRDAFVTAVEPGRRGNTTVWSSFLGGWVDRETADAIAVDSAGAPYVTGFSSSCDNPKTTRVESFPTTAGAVQPKNSKPESNCTLGRGSPDPFVTRFRADGTTLDYSTFLGSEGRGGAIGVDAAGHIYVAGSTASTAFPTKDPIPGLQSLPNPEPQAFIAELAPKGTAPEPPWSSSALEWSTYLGGFDSAHPSGSNTTDGGLGIALAANPAGGTAVHVTGHTATGDFPLVSPLQGQHGGVTDAFVAKFVPDLGRPRATSISPAEGSSAGGTAVEIEGTNLAGASGVKFGSRTVTPSWIREDGALLRAVTPPGTGTVDVTITTPSGTSAVSSRSRFSYHDGSWAATDSVEDANGDDQPRAQHSATALTGPNCAARCGKVLIVGGVSAPGGEVLGTALLYDPNPEAGAPAWGSASCAPGPKASSCPGRVRHTATQLLDGTVLVVGGGTSQVGGVASKSTQIYNPQDGTWEDAGDTVVARQGHTATLLAGPNCGQNCGKVLVVGGWRSGQQRPASLTAELYDPAKPKGERWSLAAAPLNERVWLHSATLLTGGHVTGTDCLDCGKVLIVGGASQESGDAASSSSAELYDPASGRWTASRSVLARYSHTTTVLTSGKVLIVGGAVGLGSGGPLANNARASGAVEIYDPSLPFDQSLAPPPAAEPVTGPPGPEPVAPSRQLITPRSGHVAVALPDGRALVAGGSGDMNGPSLLRPTLQSAEIYDPVRGLWVAAAPMVTARGDGAWPGGHTGTLLAGPDCGPQCGRVLVFGGFHRKVGEAESVPPTVLSSGEVYTSGPFISGLSPATGSPAGGDTVILSGSGFVAEAMTAPDSVTFGGVNAPAFKRESETTLTAVTPPAGHLTKVEVNVVVAGLGMATATFSYGEAIGAVTDLVAQAVSAKEVLLTFGATGFPPTGDYVVKQSRTPISEANFDAAQPVCDGEVCRFTPRSYRERLTVSVGGLTPETTYFYALRSKNTEGSLGPMSNVASTVTSSVTPGTVADLAATVVNEGEIRLTFSAPGSNEADPPPARRFVVKQSLGPIVDAGSFDQATALCGGECVFEPGAVGESLSLSVTGLQRKTYHYALRALDEAGNVGAISNPASATLGCVAPAGRPGQVVYPPGYHLVGLPSGTRVPSQSVLYNWFDLGRGGRYSTQEPDRAVEGGRGYWAWFSCARAVDIGGGSPTASFPLGAYRASMVGNPSGTQSAVVSGHDFTARWDPTANGGSGGYQVSGYQEEQTLAVGEGIWAFSYRDTTLSLSAQ